MVSFKGLELHNKLRMRFTSYMRAAHYSHPGPAPEVLVVGEMEKPTPGPGEVLVRIAFSGINPTDVKARSGAVPRVINDFLIPHQDGSGVIEAVGPGVDPSRVGQRVWLMLSTFGSNYGTAAEYSVTKSEFAQVLPDGCSLELGATLGVPALTAAYSLFADGPIAGQNVLVTGGAGGVGRAAIELAKWAGARVYTTVSSEAKAQIARDAGADIVVNYRNEDPVGALRGQGITRVVEVNLAANMEMDIAIAQPGMKIISYAADGPDPVLPRRPLMSAGVTIEFMLLFNLVKSKFDHAVDSVNKALSDGALTMPPVTYFSFEDVVLAHMALEAGSTERILIRL